MPPHVLADRVGGARYDASKATHPSDFTSTHQAAEYAQAIPRSAWTTTRLPARKRVRQQGLRAATTACSKDDSR